MGRSRKDEDRLFRLVLERWSEWLLSFAAPVRSSTMVQQQTQQEDVWTTLTARVRGNTEHADSVLSTLLCDERRRCSWPASIHAIVCDMPGVHQVVLLGTALRFSQAAIGEAVGVRQQFVSELLVVARQRLLARVYGLGETVIIMNEIMGMQFYHEHSGARYLRAR